MQTIEGISVNRWMRARYHGLRRGAESEYESTRQKAELGLRHFPDLDFWKDVSIDFELAEDMVRELTHNGQTPLTEKEHWEIPTGKCLGHVIDNMENTPSIGYMQLQQALQKAGSNRLRLLLAHGWEYPDGWGYCDYALLRVDLIQTWIDRHSQGNYGALVVCSCNPKGSEVNAKGTTVLYGKGDIYPDFICQQHETVLVE